MSESTTAPGAQRTTLLRGGEVHSPADPFATAMVVERGHVAWVGSEGAADAFADGVDEVVDLEGALVTPAFTDAHVHTTATGLALTGLDLSGAGTLADALRARTGRTAPPTPRTGSCSATAGTPPAGPSGATPAAPNSTPRPADGPST